MRFISQEHHSSLSVFSFAVTLDCVEIRLKISKTFSSSTFESNDESSTEVTDEGTIGGGGIGGKSCIGGMGGREEDVSVVVDVGSLLRGNATRLFKLIFRFPVGGGTNFGGSFQP